MFVAGFSSWATSQLLVLFFFSNNSDLVTKELHHFARDRQVLDLAGGHHPADGHATQVLQAGHLAWGCPEVQAAILGPAQNPQNPAGYST